MNKKLLAALGAAAGITAAAAFHGYLDIMYKETIPAGLIKRLANRSNNKAMDAFGKYTEENKKWVSAQNIENINMPSERGYMLKGYLLRAKEKGNVFVLFAHGYRADHNGDPVNFEKYYYDKGYNFMSVDHTAAGESEGNFVGFDYFESQDMLSWIDYLVNRFGEDIKIILHGVSMGGATVCKMADQVPKQVKMIISDCAYTSALDQFDETARSVGVPRTKELLGIFNFINKRLAGYDLEHTNVRPHIISSRVPMLFVHGGSDDFVPTKMVYELYGLCQREKDLLIVDGAAHAQSVMVGYAEYTAKLDDFIEKYL